MRATPCDDNAVFGKPDKSNDQDNSLQILRIAGGRCLTGSRGACPRFQCNDEKGERKTV